MGQLYTDQFWVMDPAAPPKPGSWLAVRDMTFGDRGGDGAISRLGFDSIAGHRVTHVWNGDTVTVEIPGQGQVTITGTTIYAKGMPAVFTPTDGAVLQNATFVSSTYVHKDGSLNLKDLAPACFTPGTLIETALGPRRIERIGIGDMVLTLDDGMQPVIWTGRRRVPALGRFAPVRIGRGVLGNDRALLVSPQHRVLLRGWAVQMYAGEDEMLVAALHLVDGRSVQRRPGGWVDYLHLGFARHALVRSEGIWTESHFASIAGRSEGAALFPGRVAPARLVRREGTRAESRVLASVCRGGAAGL